MPIAVVHSESMGAFPDPGRATSHPPETDAEREGAADERQRLADRASLADARERIADARERKANEREAVANERQRMADGRERKADGREAELNERQRQLDERERQLDERALRLGVAVDDLQRRVLASIERSRTLLARSGERLDRQEAALTRATEEQERQQAEVDRESAEAERHLVSGLPDPSETIERAENFRTRARSSVEAFASAQEEIARINEQLAARLPNHRDEYKRTAEQAREAARKARDVLTALTS